MTRAVSFQQDRLNHHCRSHTNSNPTPLLEELMSTSNPGNGVNTDQFLAFLCTTANKLPSGSSNFPPSSYMFPKPDIEVEQPPPNTHTTIDTCELMEGLEEQAVQQPQVEVMSKTPLEDDDNVLKKYSDRSKSCQWLLDGQLVSTSVPGRIESLLNDDDDVETDNLGRKRRSSTILRSRSFHTVEEYDALLQKMLSSTRANHARLDDNDDYYCDQGSSTQPFESSIFTTSQRTNHNDVDDIQGTAMSPQLMDKKHLLRDHNTVREEGIGIGIGLCLDRSYTMEESRTSSNIKDEGVPPLERRMWEKGSKRRAIAKGLESLEIPPSIEFPSPTLITNVRKWTNVGGQAYSPGASSSYVTPKFGSYNMRSSSSSSGSWFGKQYHKSMEEEGTLNSELVAAFEECMRQLQLEEESLLQQIEVNATNNG
ncbi:hypothetical protein LguiB_035810 [Lonicera macranthoides]